MAKKISLSSIIRPDESEYVDASHLEAGLTDAYEPVATGSAMHARPLPVNMYTVDDQSLELPDTPLARTPMRITRRYVPTTKDNIPVMTSKERPEFPLFKDEEEQQDSGIVYPKPQDKLSTFTEVYANKASSSETLYHDYESEIMQDFVPANPGIMSLLQKQGKEIPQEIALSKKLAAKAPKNNNSNYNYDRIKEAPRLYIPDSMRKTQNGVKKKDYNLNNSEKEQIVQKLQRSPDVEFTEGSSVVLTGEDLTQLGDSFSAKFYRDGTLVETFSGNVSSDGSLPLGLVKLKKGTYSVELTSGGTTLTPFKAVVKPSALSIASDNIESDSLFQKLPQSNTEPIETTGSAALPDQVKLVTEDNKANLGKVDTLVSADLPKSENKPLENQRSFLTVDQINGQKSVVFDNTSALESRNFNQDQDTGPEATSFRTLAGSDQEFSNVSGNKPLPDTNEGFSSNQNFINNNSGNDQGTSFNNSLLSSQESTSINAELPNSTPFGLSQDGRPISQNAPLGYTPDGVIISQSFELDQNGLPITQNRPLNGSVETFSTNAPLQDSESSGVIKIENMQFGSASGQNTEYQKLPEAISVSGLEQPGNLLSDNAAFENFDQQSSSPGKLQESNLSGESKNNSFAESDGGVFSENQKLTDSTIFNSGVDSQSSNKNQTGEYQQISGTNLNNNLGSSPSESIENNQVKNQSQTGTIYQSVGPDDSNTTQIDNKTAAEQTAAAQTAAAQTAAAQTAAQTVLPAQASSEQILSDNGVSVYQTRTVGSDDGSSLDNAINANVSNRATDGIYNEDVSNRATDGIYNEDVPSSGDFITQGIAPSRVLSSSMGQQNTPNSDSKQYLSNGIIGKTDQQNGQLDYVQVGNTYSAGDTADTSKINNFNLDTDLPNDFYEYKGSRAISNEDLLEEFLNSEEFKKLDEESKSRVINVKQEIQVQKDTITQSQQDDSVSSSVLSGTVLSGGQPIQDKSEPRGFAKLFTRNKQDRPVNRSQEQAQRQFEESNNLKQKVSLTLNKVFGNNEKTVSIPEYTIPDQQEQLQNSKFEDLNEDELQSDDYQFGDEDNVINRYPRITGVREALDEDYQEDLRKRRRKRRNLRYLPVGSSLESKFLQTSNDLLIESLPGDEESNIYRGLVGERDRFQNLTISEQEQNKIALRKAEHDIQQQLNKALEENIIIKENAENQTSELSADSETMFYRELVKERERFQQALSEEREQNKAALRRSEEQIQRQLIDVLTTNPQASPTQSPNDPISQVVRSLVDSGKDKEEIIIDATRIIQMIQNNQTVAGGQEIDEFLLRQRIERELKYEFKQMQLEHEQKMRLIYRRMIEDMYIDMLNS